jgi:hypothetical protein
MITNAYIPHRTLQVNKIIPGSAKILALDGGELINTTTNTNLKGTVVLNKKKTVKIPSFGFHSSCILQLQTNLRA